MIDIITLALAVIIGLLIYFYIAVQAANDRAEMYKTMYEELIHERTYETPRQKQRREELDKEFQSLHRILK